MNFMKLCTNLPSRTKIKKAMKQNITPYSVNVWRTKPVMYFRNRQGQIYQTTLYRKEKIDTKKRLRYPEHNFLGIVVGMI